MYDDNHGTARSLMHKNDAGGVFILQFFCCRLILANLVLAWMITVVKTSASDQV